MPVANRPIVNVHHQLEVRDLVLLLDGSQEKVLHALTPGWWKQGLGTNSISLSWLFKFKDRSEKVRFQQTHNQGLRHLFLTVFWDLRA